jgi:hypothetical protein
MRSFYYARAKVHNKGERAALRRKAENRNTVGEDGFDEYDYL